MERKIGIIGFGNMGKAIAEGIKSRYTVYVFDIDKNKTLNAAGLQVAQSIQDLAKNVDTLILAVKPQDFDMVLNEIKDYAKDILIISIAAGMTAGYIEKYLGTVRVVRTMPNMPAKIGQGLSCLCKGEYATKKDLDFAEKIFGRLGRTLILKEGMMDAATAISGSGPGYYFDIVESRAEEYKKKHNKVLKEFIVSLAEAAENMGFNHKEAIILAKATGEGSDSLIAKTKLAPVELKKQITSKGGTTEAGLEAFHKTGSLTEAARAALIRARELSKKG